MIGSYTQPVSDTTLQPGDSVGGYVIERLLGSGGMGKVYQVRHRVLPKSFAMKVLTAPDDDLDFIARFEREIETVSRLDHENIVSTTDSGTEDGRVWFTMTYVAGIDAQDALGESPTGLPAVEVVHIVEKVAAALDYAHKGGVLHRDVKPANILLSPTGAVEPRRVFLTDFGIAKAIDDVRPLTKSGEVPLTLDFASPEQIKGQPLDSRTDIYSLGATMFDLLTGRVPYPGDPIIKMNGHLNLPTPVPSAARPDLPIGFDDVIATAMAKDPNDRYSTASDLAAAARAALTSRDRARTVPATNVGAGDSTVIEQSHPIATTPIPGGPARPRRRRLLPVALASVIIAAVAVAILWSGSRNGTTSAGTSDSVAASTSAADELAANTAPPAGGAASTDAVTGDSASAPSSRVVPTTVQPLAELLNPAPAQAAGSIGGTAVPRGAAYMMQPKGCPQAGQRLTVDLGESYERVAGNIALDDDSPNSTRAHFVATADGTVLDDVVLSPTEGASFDLNVQGKNSLVMTVESLGQGSCNSDDYLVFLTSALAYPRQS